MKLFHKKNELSRHRRATGDLDRSGSNLAYYSRRSDEELNTGRKIQRKVQQQAESVKRKSWLQRLGLIIVMIAVVVILIHALSLSSNDQVRLASTDNSGLFIRNQAAYQASAYKLLANSVWNHNKLTVDTGQVSQALIKEYPELINVSIAIPLLAHDPIVYVQVAQPAVVIIDSHGSYVLDTNGRVLVGKNTITAFSALGLPRIIDQSGLALRPNHQALPSNDVSFIQTAVAQLAARNFKVSSMTLPATASELDVQVAGQPYVIKFNLANDDPRQQVGTYLATQASLQSQNITPAHYIDVRIDGRAYYQ